MGFFLLLGFFIDTSVLLYTTQFPSSFYLCPDNIIKNTSDGDYSMFFIIWVFFCQS